jgi:hydroxypyruvate reductase
MINEALQIFRQAVHAVEPSVLLPKFIQRKEKELRLGDQVFSRGSLNNIYVIGAGKASASMGSVAEELLGDLISEGIIVTKSGHELSLKKIRCIQAGHPIPDENGVLAGKEITRLAEKAGENDLIIALFSGGASALLADSAPGITLKELQFVSDLLLKAGADIYEMNTVRKHLSLIKGGQLSQKAYPATVVSFILSDVIGDKLDVIASGPTVADTSNFADACKVIEKYGVEEKIPSSVLSRLKKGKEGEIADTPKAGDRIFSRTHNFLIGANKIALQSAADKAAALGYHTKIMSDSMSGEAKKNAVELVQQIINYPGPTPACLLVGGETTVTVKGSGKGGRNQEFALAALQEVIRNETKFEKFPVILSAGTDGTDGPTDAAGAFLDQSIIQKAKDLSLDPGLYISNNDSYHFFSQAGGLIITGPTQTNVMDIAVVLIK